LKKGQLNIFRYIIACSAIALLLFLLGCSTPKYTCPAYTDYQHQALADSTDPSNAFKVYYAYPVLEEAAAETDSSAMTDANTDSLNTSEEKQEVEPKMEATSVDSLQETDLAKEVEEKEEWKPYTFFNIRMQVDTLGKPNGYKPVNRKWNGLVDKKKKKQKPSKADKELSEDLKRKGYIYMEPEAILAQ